MADVRLSQHIEKGNEDGLFISSVACCSSLWALIMDAGTGFTAQVYELSPSFLHKVACIFEFEVIIPGISEIINCFSIQRLPYAFFSF